MNCAFTALGKAPLSSWISGRTRMFPSLTIELLHSLTFDPNPSILEGATSDAL